MRIVINIDDRVYKNIMTYNGWNGAELAKIIRSGTPFPTGHWVGTAFSRDEEGNPVYDEWGCSLCGEEHYGTADTLTPYCPNCGSKMVEPQESEV